MPFIQVSIRTILRKIEVMGPSLHNGFVVEAYTLGIFLYKALHICLWKRSNRYRLCRWIFLFNKTNVVAYKYDIGGLYLERFNVFICIEKRFQAYHCTGMVLDDLRWFIESLIM
ncbi:hypothetical protein K501DRAFT_280681 [Backusella circina FSU 941]|nr:hypothetical protein K501DRAFT_280681 [Backusella circina FSU 941]